MSFRNKFHYNCNFSWQIAASKCNPDRGFRVHDTMNFKSSPNTASHWLKKEIPLGIAMLLILVTGMSVYYFVPRSPIIIESHQKPVSCPQSMEQLRLNDYKFTHPLLFVDVPNESEAMTGLKEKVMALISHEKSSNLAGDVSVYCRKLNDGSWFAVNGDKHYTPASLMKVVFLIAILKQAITDPGLLEKKVFFAKTFQTGYNQDIKNFTLKENKYYTIRELLNDMIIYSDNDALALISQQSKPAVINKLFRDLGVTAPPEDPSKGSEYVVTITDYCKLFRILYNSHYLTNEYSDLALNMLSQSTYRDGLLKDINPGFPVSHKFGERVVGNSAQLHEIGIFYSENEPYLLGVMSEGSDLKQLSQVLSEISKLVYQHFNGRS